MPVNKLGSKLAQEVRQIQAMQAEEVVESIPDIKPKGRNITRQTKEQSASSGANNKKQKQGSTPQPEQSKNLHPQRVWPD